MSIMSLQLSASGILGPPTGASGNTSALNINTADVQGLPAALGNVLSPAAQRRGGHTARVGSMLDWKRLHGVMGHQRVFQLSPKKKKATGDHKDSSASNVGGTGSSSSSVKEGESGDGSASNFHSAPTKGASSSSSSGQHPTGPIDALRRHLTEKLGWVENPDIKSPFADFRFSLSRRDLGIRPSCLSSNNIPGEMMINFFGCCGGLTTKNGLLRNLDRHVPLVSERIRQGLSPSFDLSDMKSVVHFVDAYQRQQCRALLWQYYTSSSITTSASGEGSSSPKKKSKSPSKGPQECQIPETIMRLAWNTATSPKPPTLTKEQWRALTQGSFTGGANPTALLGAESGLTGSELNHCIRNYAYTGLDGAENLWILKPSCANRGRGIKVVKDLSEILKYARCPPVGCLGNTNPVLAAQSAKNLAPANNASASNSRSVSTGSNSPSKRSRSASPAKGQVAGDDTADGKWMVQKYVERPLVINQRKFDIRQWVIVTSFNPVLRVWFYQEAYLRFASRPYNTDVIGDRFAHLTNNAIVKHTPDAGFKVDETMWHSDRFGKWLQDNKVYKKIKVENHGIVQEQDKRVYWPDIQRQMKKLVWTSLLSCRERVTERPQSFELFGYDFLIDECGQVWLLEVNSSPDLSFSTSTTREMVSKMMPDLLAVVLDEEKVGTGEPPRSNKKCGKFTRIEPDYSKMVASDRSAMSGLTMSQLNLSPRRNSTNSILSFSPPPLFRDPVNSVSHLVQGAMLSRGRKGGARSMSLTQFVHLDNHNALSSGSDYIGGGGGSSSSSIAGGAPHRTTPGGTGGFFTAQHGKKNKASKNEESMTSNSMYKDQAGSGSTMGSSKHQDTSTSRGGVGVGDQTGTTGTGAPRSSLRDRMLASFSTNPVIGGLTNTTSALGGGGQRRQSKTAGGRAQTSTACKPAAGAPGAPGGAVSQLQGNGASATGGKKKSKIAGGGSLAVKGETLSGAELMQITSSTRAPRAAKGA
ncbi:unnamed protein product [Amoebophrya sp. A25]|nr:unnamed protein product [Amoebophrya sp. A25]|eukprot:GSA25T00012363001.1